LDCQNGYRFGLPTGEGAPSKSEGVGGVFWRGSRGKFPLAGLGGAQGFLGFGACPNKPIWVPNIELANTPVMPLYSGIP